MSAFSSSTAVPHWDEYWSAGLLHSCQDAYAGNYADRVAEIWREHFERFPRDARILDICAGNGALALLADDYARQSGRAFEVHALDAARVHPERTPAEFAKRLERIRFRGETPAERTGYPDAWFDAVIGQFAVEYADAERLYPELARIVRPGGSVAFIAHHRGSIILAAAGAEAERIDFVLAREPVLEAARRLVESAGAVRGPADVERLRNDASTEALRLEFNAVSERVTARIRQDAEPGILRFTLGQVSAALKLWQAGDAQAALASLASCRQALAANSARLRDLLRAAWSPEETLAVQARLGAAGFTDIGIDRVVDSSQRLLGWLIAARRADARDAAGMDRPA